MLLLNISLSWKVSFFIWRLLKLVILMLAIYFLGLHLKGGEIGLAKLNKK
jgi:hypothetical protein